MTLFNYVKEEKRSMMKNELCDFCESSYEGNDVWGGFHGGALCKSYGNEDGRDCPLARFADSHGDNLIRNCAFNNPNYDIAALERAYEIIMKFKEEHPDWEKGEFGMTLDELNASYDYEDIFFDEENLGNDSTYQGHAPGIEVE